MLENLEPKPNIWEANPRLKMLLVILIFVFLASGMGLAVFAQVQNQNQLKVYKETQNSLPKHVAGVSGNQNAGICQPIPLEIASNAGFMEWLAKNQITGQFCGLSAEALKMDLPGQVLYATRQECNRGFLDYKGALATSPDGKRGLCSGSFGEPDTGAYLYSVNAGEQGRLRYCGTSCGFDGGFWLDNDRLVLLEPATSETGGPLYFFELFDFKNQTQQKWELNKYNKTAPTVLADGRLQVDSPKEGDTVGQTFNVSGYAQGWFEGSIAIKVFDASNTPLYAGSAIAGDNYGKPAPFQTSITLTATSTTSTGRIEFNDYSAKDGSLVYQKVVNIKFIDYSSISGWKIYKNYQYGFEIEYPSQVTNVGQIVNVIDLGTNDKPVKGIAVGPFAVVVLNNDLKTKTEAENYIISGENCIKNPLPPSEGGIYVKCEKINIDNPSVRIKAIDWTGEGGPAFRAITESGPLEIFFSDYGSDYYRQFTIQDEIRMLSTFKFTN